MRRDSLRRKADSTAIDHRQARVSALAGCGHIRLKRLAETDVQHHRFKRFICAAWMTEQGEKQGYHYTIHVEAEI